MDDFFNSVSWGWTIFLSILIWGGGAAAIIFYYVKQNSSHYYYSSFPVFPTTIVVTFAVAMTWIGALPILDAMADEVQYGSLVGASREILSDQYRPIYGSGGFQFLVFVLIVIVGGGVTYYRRERRY
ncbi:hypothetical protein ABLV18_27490 [Klebsiella sp. CN_Kp114]|uniref:hypothetical protein n=1 Tax=unclassified Klebsiella TaxID=2608929 RepID=UPI0032B40F52